MTCYLVSKLCEKWKEALRSNTTISKEAARLGGTTAGLKEGDQLSGTNLIIIIFFFF